MLKFGIITEMDGGKGLARVKFDDVDIVSGWLHLSTAISFGDQVQIPLKVNQHVWCTMDDQCERGVVCGAIYDETNLPAGGSNNIVSVKFGQSLGIEFNRSSKTLSITGTGDLKVNTTGKLDIEVTGDATIKCANAVIDSLTSAEIKAPLIKLTGASVQASGVLTVAGALTAASIATTGTGTITGAGNIVTTGDVIAGGKSLKTHTHTAPLGGGPTSAPL